MSPAELITLLVGTPSISGGEGPLADLVQDLVATQGFKVQRLGDNLWFSFGKQGGPRLLLNSHLDTVPPCAGWEGDPFTPVWHGARLQGLGANDAKGCVAAILLAAFELSKQELNGEVVVALTAEEETGGKGITTILDRLGPLDGAAVVVRQTAGAGEDDEGHGRGGVVWKGRGDDPAGGQRFGVLGQEARFVGRSRRC